VNEDSNEKIKTSRRREEPEEREGEEEEIGK